MKKIRLILFASLFCAMKAYSQSKLFTIYLKDMTKVSYSFCTNPVITFDAEYMILTTSEMVVNYPLRNIRKYTINEIDEEPNFRNITINNDEIESYENESDIDSCNITYIRTFHDTEWQSLYVPFELNISDLQTEVEIAIINNFHQYDDNDDGIFDRTILEIRRVTNEETLLPNYPYFIKAKTTGTKTFEIKNTTLFATEQFSVNCSSVEIEYIFTGTYTKLYNFRTLGYYYLANGTLNRPVSSSETLPPFRWYMTMKQRGSQFKEEPIIVNSSKIKIRVIGDDGNANDISNPIANRIIPFSVYSVNGIKTLQPQKSGVYIMRMNDGSAKKIFIKK